MPEKQKCTSALPVVARVVEATRQKVINWLPAGFLRTHIKAIYWAIPHRFRRIDPAADVIRILAKVSPPLRFVQIGANDGTTGDYLTSVILGRQWRGILVEPHPETFTLLQSARKGIPHLQLVNAAISCDSGKRPFYFLRYNNLVASFSKSHVEKYATTPEDVEEVFVDCFPINTLLEQSGAFNLDLLAIDTEGYDADIIMSLDFARFSVEVILFETTHLTADKRLECERVLSGAHYEIFHGAFDAVALKHDSRIPAVREAASILRQHIAAAH